MSRRRDAASPPVQAKAPLVSVVLPVWNGARFLEAAIDSILSQSLEAFELIVVDDGSSDRSAAVACECAGRDGRVRVIRLDHGGLVNALDAGIAAARGEYLARMDADDVARPSRLQKQSEFLRSHPECVAVGTWVDVIDEEGDRLCGFQYPQRHGEIVQGLLRGEFSLAHSAAMIRREAVLAVGGYRPEQFPSEDAGLWFRLARTGELANLAEPLLVYRRHRAAVSLRELRRQREKGMALTNENRRRDGLPPLLPNLTGVGTSVDANYHSQCALLALRGGNHAAALRHSRAWIALMPVAALPYMTFLAALLPHRAFPLLRRMHGEIRSRRSLLSAEPAGRPM